MQTMQSFINFILSAASIAIMLAADFGQPLGQRLIGVAAVIVTIYNCIALFCMLVVALTVDMRTSMRRQWIDASLPGKCYSVLMSLAWLGALAWVGWLWAFGIRLVWDLVRVMVIQAEKG